MEKARRELRRMRESPEAWPDLAYEPATDAEGSECDGNAARRAQVLWALQYDRRPSDLALVRWIAEQEARCRRKAPFQGMTEEAELAGFLLAEHQLVEDVWRHWQLKRANFDTWCGYDRRHLCAAGVGATLAYVRESAHPDRDEVLDLGLEEFSEESLAEWTGHQRERFPSDPAAEEPLLWVERAKLAGDLPAARQWLDRWAADRPRDAETLNALQYELADLGAFGEAAAVQREAVAHAEGAWYVAAAWLALAALERQAGERPAAWAALGECRRALDGVPGWTEVGLGRAYAHELYLVADTAEQFAAADRQARQVPRLPPVALAAAAAAAKRTGA
ncbi:hypothetical protein M1L60_40115 [Actinoplanes sp. TRM 88003]|uniref:DUF4034 domain-containing protein n=1 Tax=Paractinoplanes aksuensis TaxID=2939490 RepID=A0ABT1E0X7_9ACTN|nr:hypothetical protein [Actinoplanes aksuensis]MCO8276804.1 hypothetical protein [Actinoplanes aksuensis]